MYIEPLLPPEIERETLELTALSHPGTIPALLRVAKRVYIWIEPLLYRIISLKHERDPMVLALKEAITSKPPEFLRNAVRHLILNTDDNFSIDRKQLLRLCEDIITFVASDSFLDSALLPILAEMRVQRLSLKMEALFRPEPINFGHPLFSHVTHLDLLDIYSASLVVHLPHVPLLPALTHLCLDTSVPRDSMLRVLEDCPRLQLLLVQWYHSDVSYASAKTPHAYDVRFVIGTYSNYWEECKSSAMGGPDFWAEADDFVARKRKGEIEVTRYWLR
ncbi:hypothetical protein K438DRAFT_1840640 [Mycena galopus ATCC 62051]|nr:hypothetical protein K438DRAFT_1840640 [Mycena galopus ATCC 62051]